MNVEEQMGIANEVLVSIKMNIDEDAIIAGGAPRNWQEGKLANDIDLYTRCFVNNTSSRLRNLLKRVVGKDIKFTQSVDIQNYCFGIDIEIVRLISFDHKGVNVQVIVCNPNREYDNFKMDVVNHMDIGLNRIWCDWYNHRERHVNKTIEYIKDFEDNTLTLHPKCMTDAQLKHCMENHLPKMQRYYPNHNLKIKD